MGSGRGVAVSDLTRPLPALRPKDGWQEIEIVPTDEDLVAVADIGPRVHEDPRYAAMGFPGAIDACLLRAGVAERLGRVAASLPDGIDLLVWDGWRPFSVQKALYDQYLNELIAVHPEWPHDAIEDAAARYVSPPSRSVDAPAPHLTGGAVDLTLCDRQGRPRDMGTGFDAFVPAAAAAALEGSPGPVRDNRRLLFWAMSAEGFTEYSEEWWHYDHGDQFWALARAEKARYGPAQPTDREL